VPAELPASLEPELATLVDKPLPGDWIYEIKFDG
jgi:bifunctional non-homologous end joining protein LigD